MPEVREYTPSRFHSFNPSPAVQGAPTERSTGTSTCSAPRVIGEPIVMDDGTVGHAELLVGDTVFMLADEYPVEGVRGPDELGGNSVTLMLYVPDVERTVRAGARAGRDPDCARSASAQYGARDRACSRDPFGHRWFVGTALEADDRPGRGRARPALRRHRLPHDRSTRWRARPPLLRRALRLAVRRPGRRLPHRHRHAAVRHPRRRVNTPDVKRLLPRRRHRTGRGAGYASSAAKCCPSNDYPSGGNAECVDDQGLRFDLFRPRPGY